MRPQCFTISKLPFRFRSWGRRRSALPCVSKMWNISVNCIISCSLFIKLVSLMFSQCICIYFGEFKRIWGKGRSRCAVIESAVILIGAAVPAVGDQPVGGWWGVLRCSSLAGEESGVESGDRGVVDGVASCLVERVCRRPQRVGMTLVLNGHQILYGVVCIKCFVSNI